MIHRFSNTSFPTPGGNQAGFNAGQIQDSDPLVKVHDPESPDMVFAIQKANEIINKSGAAVSVYQRTQNNHVDDVWEEDADPTYYAAKNLKGLFVPQPNSAELTRWAVDAPNSTSVVFSRAHVTELYGDRMIIPGDVIELPFGASSYIKPSKFEVKNAFDSGNYRYFWLYWTCEVESLRDDITLVPD